jgi:hypothetical protein
VNGVPGTWTRGALAIGYLAVFVDRGLQRL